jgi:D-inositol-3-phosphate glycosyltransferase
VNRRLLIVGQAAHTSGYGRVLRSLARQLAGRLDVRYLTLNVTDLNVTDLHLPEVETFAPAGRSDPYGLSELPAALRRLRPDILFACHDAEVLAEYARVVRGHAPQTRVVVYVPLEWQAIGAQTAAGLRLADHVVCYTEVARRWLTRAWRADGRRPTLSVLPHGIDHTVFGPIGAGGTVETGTDRQRARCLARAMLRLGTPDDFVVLNANRDTDRKRLDLTVRAFAALARHAPDARLVLVHGHRLLDEAQRLGVRERVSVPAGPLDDHTLNLYFNAADVGVNTSTAEGWGLIALEHASSGVAQVVPDHPACREIWDGNAVLAPCAAGAVEGYGEVSVDGCAQRLSQLHRDRPGRRRWDEAARRVAATERYGWEHLAEQWWRILQPNGSSTAIANSQG